MIGEHLKKSELFVLLSIAFLLVAVQINKKYVENPPIITLSEGNENYRFSSGSDGISRTYRNKLCGEIAPYLDSLSIEYNCNAIQIIGHTSGKVLKDEKFPESNLDEHLAESVYQSVDLKPSSNVDLGMMRAVAIMKELKGMTEQGYLKNIHYWFPYSAGQLIETNGELIDLGSIWLDRDRDPADRRRVEIRLFRYEDR